MVSQVKLNVRLELVTRKDGDAWLAWCLPLDVMSQAETQTGAVQALKEAVELWFESSLERGVLDGALKEAGFTICTHKQAEKSASMIMVSKKFAAVHEVKKPKYIEVIIPAYIAAAQMGTSATC